MSHKNLTNSKIANNINIDKKLSENELLKLLKQA